MPIFGSKRREAAAVEPASANDVLCQELSLAIANATDTASPDQILKALDAPVHPTNGPQYSRRQSELRLVCVNHGIDPSTGSPDRELQEKLAGLLRSGYSEQQVLAGVGLASHKSVPMILMRDGAFSAEILPFLTAERR